jgi:hypothetical protein
MTISSVVCRNDYLGDGAGSEYCYTFKIFADSDLRVTVRNTGGVQTLLVLDTDYSVSGAGEAGGGVITLVAGREWMTPTNLKTGYALTIRRNRPATQTTDIRNQGEFYPETLEDAYDHLVMLVQAVKDELARAMKLMETEAGSDAKTTFPSATERAGKVLAFDDDGNPIAAIPVGGVNQLTLETLTTLPDGLEKPTLCVVETDGVRTLFFWDGSDWTALLTMK